MSDVSYTTEVGGHLQSTLYGGGCCMLVFQSTYRPNRNYNIRLACLKSFSSRITDSSSIDYD
eukprot:1520113-Amphidinium_carterae.1